MLVGTFIDVFKGLETNSVLGGIGYLEIVQQVIDDVYSDDIFSRLERPPPFVDTTAAQLVYTWEELLASYLDGNSVTTIRRIRGLWDPSLSPDGPSTTTDYGRKPASFFEQKDIHRRVYDGDVYVDQERKLVTFKNDPLTTTDKWKVDLYLLGPQVTEASQVPFLVGWEKKLLLSGCRAWFEELDKGGPGPQAQIFHNMKSLYRDAVQRETRISEKTEDLGIDVDGPMVRPL